MNRKTQIIRAGIFALLGLCFAGSAVYVLAAGMGLGVSGMTVYASAFAAALLAGGCTLTGPAAAVSGILLACGFVAALVFGPGDMAALKALAASWQGVEADAALVADGGRMLAVLSAYGLGALFTGLVARREFAPLSVMIYIGLAVVGCTLSDGAGIAACVPGMIAAVTACALSAGAQRDGSGLRLVIPAVLVVALAMLAAPTDRPTWQPLADAAERVRGIFEQYFNFSSERVAFSINEKGYDHAGMIGDDVVAMLGGPADPDTEPVMTVTADSDILLRGTIRTAYTGYSWIDETVKNRYLYYDVTHSNVRGRVFGTDFDSDKHAFEPVDVHVEMLSEGTSTLFVPARLPEFSMDLSNAVYYNSAGEMFMARPVQPGDRYSLTALEPVHGEALSEAVMAASEEKDDRYAAILEAHTALPAGIDSEVYTLAIELTGDCINPYDKALAIRDHLAANYHYTLEPDYPPENRDFVSYFLMESKEGYCSYFATAMAVLGRIAGLPTRYVEGYLARPDADGTVTLTGEDAHAWVEVYFRGVGWIAFDPSGGQQSGGDDGFTDDEHFDTGSEMEIPEDEPLTTPTPTPSPTPALHPGEDRNSLDNFESDDTDPEPTPTLPPTDESEDPFGDDDDTPEDWGEPTVDESPWSEKERAFTWLWILLGALILAALIAAAVWFVRRRLMNADPLYLSAKARDGREAAMILYRGCLTLLAHMGLATASGESPEAFARRVSAQLEGDDFARFVSGVSAGVYANRAVDRETIAAGRRAYAAFAGAMRPAEKLRFALTRIFKGLGSFESIP